jgi:hypothetical protein
MRAEAVLTPSWKQTMRNGSCLVGYVGLCEQQSCINMGEERLDKLDSIGSIIITDTQKRLIAIFKRYNHG